MARVWMPLPDRDFDPTESAVPWHVLTSAGHDVVFATEHGGVPACDPLMLTGVVFGQLGAKAEARELYARMSEDAAFRAPLRYGDVDPAAFDGLWLAGGHAKGMRPYLESAVLRERVRAAWGRPVAAICHGVLVLARAGVLAGVRTTCLPKYMEQAAYFATAWAKGDYYRTYPEYVEDEVRRLGADVVRGPITLFAHGTREDDGPAFVVEDGAYVSARWPGDAWRLARVFAGKL
ncbi:MAG: type 1 glutamine amidotransferase domain-containing protein [Myxococcota bacterium]